MLIELTTKS